MKFPRSLLIRFISIAWMSCALVSCGGGDGKDPGRPLTYASAKQLWTDSGQSSYRFTLTRSCFCIPEGSITVIVQFGKVSSAFYTQTMTGVSEDRLKSLPTLSGLFQLADEAYAKNAAQVDVTFNSALGYLESLYIDFDKTMADEEIRYQVSDFIKG